MADEWFEIATLEHFWVQRRFNVLAAILGNMDLSQFKVCEIGCGHGIVQRQFFEHYGVEVAGFDLNIKALNMSYAKNLPRYYYNIHERHPDFKRHFDFIILFDVIEHIEDDEIFLDSVLYHLKPSGCIAVNVPSLPFLYSDYDRVAGHVRRYNKGQIRKLGRKLNLTLLKITYWGMPLIPLLLLRNIRSFLFGNSEKVIERGFHPPFAFVNKLLGWLSALEIIPQALGGTSLMCLFQYNEKRSIDAR